MCLPSRVAVPREVDRRGGVSGVLPVVSGKRPSGIARSALRPRASRHDVMLCCTKFLKGNRKRALTMRAQPGFAGRAILVMWRGFAAKLV